MKTLHPLLLALALSTFPFLRSIQGVKMASTTAQRVAKNLSGSCHCRAISWKLSETPIGQICVCHCTICRKMAGGTSVPFLSLPRKELLTQLKLQSAVPSTQVDSSSNLKSYQVTDMATRYFCGICSSMVCMEYHHESHTLWVPMGNLDNFTPDLIDPTKDSHIFQQNEAEYLGKLDELQHYQDFGLYKSDNCCGKPWHELKDFDELD